jgi:hypothetical protein
MEDRSFTLKRTLLMLILLINTPGFDPTVKLEKMG